VRLTFLQGRWNKHRKRGIRKERIKGKKKRRNMYLENLEMNANEEKKRKMI
jgi:hypothetical protein